MITTQQDYGLLIHLFTVLLKVSIVDMVTTTISDMEIISDVETSEGNNDTVATSNIQ